jgi:xylulokinase
VEGVLFAVGAAFDLLDVPDDGAPVVLSGGGARHPVVRQLLADVLGRPVAHLPLRSASATGAALLAGRGVGLDVVPLRKAAPAVLPRRSPDLAAAAQRWAGQTAAGPGTRT